MNHRLIEFIILISMLVILVSCTPSNASEDEASMYKGIPLTIGIVGTNPHVLEENITFRNIDLDSLNERTFGSFDAIIITKDSLEQASDSKYVNIYTESQLPFVFLESKKSFFPFIYEHLDYKSAAVVDSSAHAILYLRNVNGEEITWKYSLYNDKRTVRNIKEVYSRIFSTIEELVNIPLK